MIDKLRLPHKSVVLVSSKTIMTESKGERNVDCCESQGEDSEEGVLIASVIEAGVFRERSFSQSGLHYEEGKESGEGSEGSVEGQVGGVQVFANLSESRVDDHRRKRRPLRKIGGIETGSDKKVEES